MDVITLGPMTQTNNKQVEDTQSMQKSEISRKVDDRLRQNWTKHGFPRAFLCGASHKAENNINYENWILKLN